MLSLYLINLQNKKAMGRAPAPAAHMKLTLFESRDLTITNCYGT